MSERSFSQDGGTIVAHRGASAREAENTIEAFELAIAAGADAVELDVRMTATGVPVVLHDADLARTTDASGLVASLTLPDVRRARIRTAAGGWTRVPTLAEALRCCAGRIGVDIEVKNVPGEPDYEPDRQRAVEATLATLDALGFADPVLISSFNPLAIAEARRLAPDVPTGLLTPPSVEADAAVAYARAEGHAWALPAVDRVRDRDAAALAAAAHGAGVRVGTWVVDDPGEALELFAAGVDAVATNDPGPIAAARGTR